MLLVGDRAEILLYSLLSQSLVDLVCALFGFPELFFPIFLLLLPLLQFGLPHLQILLLSLAHWLRTEFSCREHLIYSEGFTL